MKLTVDFSDVKKPERIRFPAGQRTFALALMYDAHTEAVKYVREAWEMSVQDYVDMWIEGPEEILEEFQRDLDTVMKVVGEFV